MTAKTTTAKIHLVIDGDRSKKDEIYNYLRRGMYHQSRVINMITTALYDALQNGADNEALDNIMTRAIKYPVEYDPASSLYPYEDFYFPSEVSSLLTAAISAKEELYMAINNGLLRGSVSLPVREKTAPLLIDPQFIVLYHEYGSNEELEAMLYNDTLSLYIDLIDTQFIAAFGPCYKSKRVRDIIRDVLTGDRSITGGSIEIDEPECRLYLNLDVTVPEMVVDTAGERELTISYGTTIPVVCHLSDSRVEYIPLGASCFFNAKASLEAQRYRATVTLNTAKRQIEKQRQRIKLAVLKEKEKKFKITFNNNLSRRIVQFAVDNKARHIKIAVPEGIDSGALILADWPYEDMYARLKHKAHKFGIEVSQI